MLKQSTYHNSNRVLHRLRHGERGVAAIMMAILFAVFIAFAGMVLDGGRIYFEKRRMQAAADAAAYGGALELRRGFRPNLNLETEIVTAGCDDSKLNGF
jgi:Flp pilus assembly protein TadG